MLVVEDQALIALLMMEELAQAGHDPIGPAVTSSEAIHLAQTHRPDVALVDLDLETTGIGLDVARRLTADMDIDVVLCTGQPDVARRIQSGAIGLIRKPYDPKDVIESIEALEAIRHDATAKRTFPQAFEFLLEPQ